MHTHHAELDAADGRALGRRASGVGTSLLGVAALAGLAFLAACTSTESQIETGGQIYPRPQVVLVDTFATSPGEVQVSAGLSDEVQAILDRGARSSRTEQELQAGRQVADALANKLVLEIRDLGLNAERGSALPPGVQNAVLITGQLVSIDEGNEAERVVIGLGAGRSSVRAQVQVFELTPTSSRLIDTVEVDAKSGMTPGMAETMGAGALAGHLLVSTVVSTTMQVATETLSDTVVADADRAAKGIAKQLSGLFRQQGWTS
jgi:hypothetical protein